LGRSARSSANPDRLRLGPGARSRNYPAGLLGWCTHYLAALRGGLRRRDADRLFRYCLSRPDCANPDRRVETKA
jgi:hypothetical protein